MSLTRSFLVSILAIFIILPSVAAKSSPLDSIRPLELLTAGEGDVKDTWTVICPAFRVQDNTGHRYWMTAGHCLDMTGVYRIDGKDVSVKRFKVDAKFDGGLLEGGPSASTLALAVGTPNVLTPIYTAGYPHGSPELHVTTGTAASRGQHDQRVVWQVPVFPGISGAPVIESKSGMVVGMVTQSECPLVFGIPTWCPVGLGTPVGALREYLNER